MDRRSFVKTCVGVSFAGALAASGLSVAAGLAIPRKATGALVTYWGAHRVAGPAPRGLPYIPLTVDSSGNFVGKGKIKLLDGTETPVVDWFKYCGHSGAPGLKETYTGDDVIYYLKKDDYKKITPWFADKLEQPIRPEHFPAEGFGAAFSWRSIGQSGTNVISGSIIRAAKFPALARAGVEQPRLRFNASPVAPASPLSKDAAEAEAYMKWLRTEVFHEDPDTKDLYIGVSTYCTHFCCTPAFRESEALARPRDAWDNIFCTCHNSNYDFREPVRYTMAPEVATEAGGFDPLFTRGESSGGGGH